MEEVSYQRLLGVIVERLEVGVFAVDPSHRIVLWNRYMAMHSGKSIADIRGKNLFEVFPEIPGAALSRKMDTVFSLGNYAFSAWELRPYLFKFKHNRPIIGGVDAMRQNATFIPIKNQQGQVRLVVVMLSDVTEMAWIQTQLVKAIEESHRERNKQRELILKLEEAKSQLFQAEKMASIGQLAAGVAHEINNPIGFVHSNLGSLARGVSDLLALIETYEVLAAALPQDLQSQIADKKRALDFNYLKDDVGAMIKESKEGLDHVRRIVADLKDFSRVDQSGWQSADIEKCLDTTLNVASNELKYRVTLVREYAHPPPIECVPGQINQVLMNLVVNAAQAFEERGTITLTTGQSDDKVWVEVADDGVGIAEDNLHRIFDPFFTTKPVGKGTGLGLSVCYNIVRKHHGDLTVKSSVGVGSVFRLVLPIRQPLTDPDRKESVIETSLA
jgi:signal transduction histidine kinase